MTVPKVPVHPAAVALVQIAWQLQAGSPMSFTMGPLSDPLSPKPQPVKGTRISSNPTDPYGLHDFEKPTSSQNVREDHTRQAKKNWALIILFRKWALDI